MFLFKELFSMVEYVIFVKYKFMVIEFNVFLGDCMYYWYM